MSKPVDTIPLDRFDLRLEFLRPFSQKSIKQMLASMTKHGQMIPVTVLADNEKYVLIDGFKRYHAALLLKYESLRMTNATVTSSEAKAMIYLLNQAGSFSIIQEAMIVRDLVEVEGLNQVEAATLLERHKSWVNRRLMMIRSLAPQIVEDIKLGLIPAGSGSTMARLQQCNQADFAVVIQTHHLKPNEIRKLVDLWCKANDPEVKQFLLQAPRQALDTINGNKNKKTGLWLEPIHAIIKNIDRLGKRLDSVKLSQQAGMALRQFLDQIGSQIELIKQQIQEEHN